MNSHHQCQKDILGESPEDSTLDVQIYKYRSWKLITSSPGACMCIPVASN